MASEPVYLLDTNICVYLIRNRSPQVLRKLSQRSVSDVGLSSITVAELQFGVQKSSRPEQNQQAPVPRARPPKPKGAAPPRPARCFAPTATLRIIRAWRAEG